MALALGTMVGLVDDDVVKLVRRELVEVLSDRLDGAEEIVAAELLGLARVGTVGALGTDDPLEAVACVVSDALAMHQEEGTPRHG